jgi:chromosomal replication initiator protein
MYVAREVAGLSYPRIAAFFGRDHTTVLHSCQKTEGELAKDPTLAVCVRQLLREAA